MSWIINLGLIAPWSLPWDLSVRVLLRLSMLSLQDSKRIGSRVKSLLRQWGPSARPDGPRHLDGCYGAGAVTQITNAWTDQLPTRKAS